MIKYYVDSCIWIDFWEDRKGFMNKPLGKYAAEFFLKAFNNKILISDVVLSELRDYMYEEDIEELMNIFYRLNIIEFVRFTAKDMKISSQIAEERDIPANDVLHALIASKNDAMLISQDKHFFKLKDIVIFKRPQDL